MRSRWPHPRERQRPGVLRVQCRDLGMKIVAVWRDDNGVLHVVPPCGRCREFIRQIVPANLDTEVVLSWSSSAKLRDLVPFSEWPG
jgi:cytidine deaminase